MTSGQVRGRAGSSVNRVGSATRVWLGSSEHDDGAGGEDLRAFAASAADLVDDVLEVLEIADADAGEGVWVAGEGERFDDFWEVGDRGVDFVDLGARCESELDERFDLLACDSVVEQDGVAADQADALEAIDSAFGGRWRESDESADLARRSARVGQEDVDDVLVGCIEVGHVYVEIITSPRPIAFRIESDRCSPRRSA